MSRGQGRVYRPKVRGEPTAVWWLDYGVHGARHRELRRRAKRRELLVFHRNGRPIKSYRGTWALACKRANLVGRIPHDLRRTAARDLRRAGVSEGEIMKLCGWKTRAMFDRYNIIDEQDLAAAVAKRFNGKQAANTEGAASGTTG